MAGRARTIKPAILEDEKTAGLSHLEWRLFVSLWLMADDHGNLRSEPAFIRSHALWAASEQLDAVKGALDQLVSVGLVLRYAVRGQGYLHITNWSRHQKIDRPSKPQMPGPDEGESDSRDARETLATVSQQTREDSSQPPEHRTLARHSRDTRETLALERKGKDRRGEEADSRVPREGSLSAGLPAGWEPDPSARQIATERSLDLRHEVAQFRDHVASTGRKSSDWSADFRKWLRNSRDVGSRSSGGATMSLPVKQTGRVFERKPKSDGSVGVLEWLPDGNAEFKTDDEIAELRAEGLL